MGIAVKGYEGIYEIVGSEIYNLKKERAIKQRINKDGYLIVDLIRDGKRTTKTVHRIIAETLIPNVDNLPQVNHKDENILNNDVNNLEWCTQRYNNNYGTRLDRISGVLKKKPKPGLRKAVKRKDLITGEVKIYTSYIEAEKEGFISSGISSCVAGRSKTYKDNVWAYADSEFKNPFTKKIKGTHIESGETLIFDSIAAAKEAGFTSNSSLYAALNKQRKHYKKYQWERIEP